MDKYIFSKDEIHRLKIRCMDWAISSIKTDDPKTIIEAAEKYLSFITNIQKLDVSENKTSESSFV